MDTIVCYVSGGWPFLSKILHLQFWTIDCNPFCETDLWRKCVAIIVDTHTYVYIVIFWKYQCQILAQKLHAWPIKADETGNIFNKIKVFVI